MAREHSMLEQLKSQLNIDRNIMGDDSINMMPDSGNVDAFERKLVSAAEPTNLSLKVRDGSFGAENADGVVSVFADDDEDEFGGNDNNRRVAIRVAKEKAALAADAKATAKRKDKAQAAPSADVLGEQEAADAEANENNARVDKSQLATGVDMTGGVLGHAEGGEQHPAGGMPGAAFKAAEPAKDTLATPKDKVGKDEAAKGGRPAPGWKPNA